MNKKKLIGYVSTKDLPSLTKKDICMLDGINLAFARIKDNCVLYAPDEHFVSALHRIRSLNSECKIILSVGGWTAGGFSEAAATKSGRECFAETAADLLDAYKLDGLDIDWEYPCIDAAGIAASPADKVTFTKLIKTCRAVLDKKAFAANSSSRKMLTIAAGAGQYFVDNTQMAEVQQYLDYVQLMTYDLRGASRRVTGHHASLFNDPEDESPNKSAESAVLCFLNAGVPPEKLILGAAYYSRIWKGVDMCNNGLHQQAQTAGDYGPGYGTLVDAYIGKNGYTRFFDANACSPWLFNGDTFISYDDEQSCSEKAFYVNKKDLGGIMFWEYGLDETHTLTQCLRTALDSHLV